MTKQGTPGLSALQVLSVLMLYMTGAISTADVLVDTTAQLTQATVTFLLPPR